MAMSQPPQPAPSPPRSRRTGINQATFLKLEAREVKELPDYTKVFSSSIGNLQFPRNFKYKNVTDTNKPTTPVATGKKKPISTAAPKDLLEDQLHGLPGKLSLDQQTTNKYFGSDARDKFFERYKWLGRQQYIISSSPEKPLQRLYFENERTDLISSQPFGPVRSFAKDEGEEEVDHSQTSSFRARFRNGDDTSANNERRRLFESARRSGEDIDLDELLFDELDEEKMLAELNSKGGDDVDNEQEESSIPPTRTTQSLLEKQPTVDNKLRPRNSSIISRISYGSSEGRNSSVSSNSGSRKTVVRSKTQNTVGLKVTIPKPEPKVSIPVPSKSPKATQDFVVTKPQSSLLSASALSSSIAVDDTVAYTAPDDNKSSKTRIRPKTGRASVMSKKDPLANDSKTERPKTASQSSKLRVLNDIRSRLAVNAEAAAQPSTNIFSDKILENLIQQSTLSLAVEMVDETRRHRSPIPGHEAKQVFTSERLGDDDESYCTVSTVSTMGLALSQSLDKTRALTGTRRLPRGRFNATRLHSASGKSSTPGNRFRPAPLSMSTDKLTEENEEKDDVDGVSRGLITSPRTRYLVGCLQGKLLPIASVVLRKHLVKRLALQHHGLGDENVTLLAKALQALPHIQSINVADNMLTGMFVD
jgi:hypothetical protein